MINENGFKKYMDIQISLIEKYKWVESEKAGYDLGQKAVLDWIVKYAKKFEEEHKYLLEENCND